MNPYQISDANLAQSLQNGQLAKTHLDFRMEGGKIQVTENQQFKKEMEQNIYNHFNFMLRIAFYHGVFDEITNFIRVYQQQFSKSTELYEYWKEIDQITDSVALQVSHAEQRIEMIEQYNEAPVQMEEFNEFKKQMSFAFLDKEFRIQTVLQNQEDEKARAEFEADAITTLKEGKIYLEWLKIQKPKQQQFKEELDEITQQWNDQYQIYVAGRTFIDNIDRNQIAIFTQKSWESDNWIQQLQDQIHNTIPFFEKLNSQYLKCLQYYFVLNEFKENVLVNKEIKENLIETAIRIAEKPYIEKFLKYFYEKEEKAIILLNTLQSIDQGKRLLQVSRNQNELIFQIERAFNNLDIQVTQRQETLRNANSNTIYHQITYISDVTLCKTRLSFQYENPDSIQWDPRTKEQIEVLNEIQSLIKQLTSKLDRLEYLQKRYQELKQLPQQIALKYKQEFEIQIQQGEIKKAQFTLLLKQSEQENYDSLTYSQQSMPLLLGALCKNIVIKRNASCMCCSRQPPHNSDDMFYEEYIKVVAQEIRNMNKLENKWLISNQERINQTKDLPAIQSTAALILNHSIIGALRNDDGSRQMKNGKREFYPYASIAKTIQELCHLVIVDQKRRLNLTSATVNERVLNWTMSLQNAQLGQLARNYSLPINGPQ